MPCAGLTNDQSVEGDDRTAPRGPGVQPKSAHSIALGMVEPYAASSLKPWQNLALAKLQTLMGKLLISQMTSRADILSAKCL